MTLKEEVYQAVHDYLKIRVDQLSEEESYTENSGCLKSNCIKAKLVELLKIQCLIGQMFADYNEKLANENTK